MKNDKLDALVASGAIREYSLRKSAVNDGEFGVEYAEELTITFSSGETLNLQAATDGDVGFNTSLEIT